MLHGKNLMGGTEINSRFFAQVPPGRCVKTTANSRTLGLKIIYFFPKAGLAGRLRVQDNEYFCNIRSGESTHGEYFLTTCSALAG
ncbi:hypothetical protein AB3347_13655 [Massilia sp. X63]